MSANHNIYISFILVFIWFYFLNVSYFSVYLLSWYDKQNIKNDFQNPSPVNMMGHHFYDMAKESFTFLIKVTTHLS